MRTFGAAFVIFSISGGISSSTARSGTIRRNCRSLRAASKSSGMNRERTWSSACASGPRSACARGVSSIRAPVRTNKGSPTRSRSRCSAWLVAGWDSPIRIAARLTLASLSSASSATSKLRSSEFKFMELIDTIFPIDWKNAAPRAMVVGNANQGRAAMSVADNRKLMESIFAGDAVGDRSLFVDSLADDVTMTVTGQYSWSQTFHGRESVLRDLYGYVASLVKYRRTVPFRLIADDQWVAVEARGDMETHAGERYDNHYCLLYRIENGKIREIRE